MEVLVLVTQGTGREGSGLTEVTEGKFVKMTKRDVGKERRIEEEEEERGK